MRERHIERATQWAGYGWAVAAAIGCTAIGFAMRSRFDLVNIAMVYVLAVVLVARYFSRGPAVVVTVLGVLAFDVLFVPPEGVLMVHDAQYTLTFAIMLVIGLIVARLVEDARRQARTQAALEVQAETERQRNVLLASISHDLRTPLAVISGASSTLVETAERLGAEQRSALAQSIFERSSRMSEHVDKILQVTRLETGAISPERDWVPLAEICGSALLRLRESLAGHCVLVEVDEDLPLVRADAALIEQALANLLENAARHTPAGTEVRLSVDRSDGEIVVTVADNAAGATPDLDGIFENRRRRGFADREGGVGLGLAICKAIVQLHEGRIWAERLPGAGKAFRFTLPAGEPPPPPREAGA